MGPYLIILVGLLLLQFIKVEAKKDRYLYIAACLTLYLFAILRGNGDGDYFTYREYSTYIQTFSDLFNNDFPMEFGFRLLSFIKNKLGLNSQWIIVFMNTLSLFIIFYCMKKVSKDKYLSLLLFIPYYLTLDMHASRIAIAVAIGLYSMLCLINKKNILFFLLVFISSLFHKSALILLIIYLISKIKLKTIFTCSMILILLSVFVNIPMIIIRVLSYTPLSNFAYRLDLYINDIRYGYPMSIIDPRIILFILVIFNAVLIYKYLNENQCYFLKILITGVTVLLVFHNSTFLALRLSAYFTIITLCLIPEIISIINRNKNDILNDLNEYALRFKIDFLKNIPIKQRYKLFFNKFITIKNIYFFIYIIYILGIIYLNCVQYKLFFEVI